MRRAARKDGNHNEIAKAFRTLGCSWRDTHQIGEDFPDGIAGISGVDVQVEVKDGSLRPSARKLRPGQAKHREEWRGRTPEVIESLDDVVALVNSIRSASAQRALDKVHANQHKNRNYDE